MHPKIKRFFYYDQSNLEQLVMFLIKRGKFLIMVLLFSSLSSQVYSTNQGIESNLCCGKDKLANNASAQQAMIIICLMENQWVEEFDDRVATSHRILRFLEQGALEITTIFEGGFAESEEAIWEFIKTEQGDFLGIDDPVLGERVLYQFKFTDLGIQLAETGQEGESTHFYRAPIPSLISY